MKRLMVAICFTLTTSPPALAQDKGGGGPPPGKAGPWEKQEKAKACSQQAAEKSLYGDARKKFMSTCMKR